MFQLFQDIPEPIRQRTLQFQRLPGGRVDEPEPAGVQALAGQSGPWLFAAVHRIPQQRMADGRPDGPESGGYGLFPAGTPHGYSQDSGPERTSGSPPPGPFLRSTAIFFRSTGWRPMGASTVPQSSRKPPTATASYTRAGSDPGAGRPGPGWARSFLAATIRPEVSRSMRWTMPGRSSR